ncbi:MAG TPA: hypothetical protein DCZ43_09505 [candidate division Zixibacteria bacterium]|nr:hypothetical protein [candidate division Zixibacteria bacterium]
MDIKIRFIRKLWPNKQRLLAGKSFGFEQGAKLVRIKVSPLILFNPLMRGLLIFGLTKNSGLKHNQVLTTKTKGVGQEVFGIPVLTNALLSERNSFSFRGK